MEDQLLNSKWFLGFLILNMGKKSEHFGFGYMRCLPAYLVPVLC